MIKHLIARLDTTQEIKDYLLKQLQLNNIINKDYELIDIQKLFNLNLNTLQGLK